MSKRFKLMSKEIFFDEKRKPAGTGGGATDLADDELQHQQQLQQQQQQQQQQPEADEPLSANARVQATGAAAIAHDSKARRNALTPPGLEPRAAASATFNHHPSAAVGGGDAGSVTSSHSRGNKGSGGGSGTNSAANSVSGGFLLPGTNAASNQPRPSSIPGVCSGGPLLLAKPEDAPLLFNARDPAMPILDTRFSEYKLSNFSRRVGSEMVRLCVCVCVCVCVCAILLTLSLSLSLSLFPSFLQLQQRQQQQQNSFVRPPFLPLIFGVFSLRSFLAH